MSRAIEREEVDRYFLQIFEDDKRGQVVFEDLYQRFASKAKVHTNGGIDAVLKTFQDSAHREVIEYIVARCNAARMQGSEQTTTIEAPQE